MTTVKKGSAALLLAALFISIWTQTTLAAMTSDTQQLEVPHGNSASLNWSGYVAGANNPADTYTSVTGTWIVPSVTATNADAADATWVGIGGVESHDLLQAGTQAVVMDGTVTYNAWIELLPDVSRKVPLAVHSGDSITATLSEELPGVWHISIKNNTTGTEFTKSVEYDSSRSSAEWVQEMVSTGYGDFIPLDSFGQVAFSGAAATKDGESKNLAELGAQPLHMVSGEGHTLASSTAVGSDGSSFTVTRTDAMAAVAAQTTPILLIVVRHNGHNYIFTAPYHVTVQR